MASMYEDVLAHLLDSRVQYIVTGGVSIVLRGMRRPVADLDVVVAPAPENLKAVTGALAQLDFWPTLPLPLELVPMMRLLDANNREVDVNRLYPIAFTTLWKRADHLIV